MTLTTIQAGTNIAQVPSLLTTVEGHDYARLRSHGYEAIWFQHMNVGNNGYGPVYTYSWSDQSKIVNAGMKPCVWGCSYGLGNQADPDAFYRDGRAMGSHAVALGAAELMADIEYASVGTRSSSGLLPFVQGVRDGGWTKPVHWTPLGAPDDPKTLFNPKGNDYNQDEKSILDTGGCVFHQDYVNAHAGYDPALSVAYYEVCGVPRARQNVMIWLGTMPASNWIDAINRGGLGAAVSGFMAEYSNESELTALEVITKKVVDVDKLAAQAAFSNFTSSTIGMKDLSDWKLANSREADRYYNQHDYDPAHYTTKFGKFLAGMKNVTS
jgi:hypothetical protein